WLAQAIGRPEIVQYGMNRDLWLIAHMAAAAELSVRNAIQANIQELQSWGWTTVANYSRADARTLEGMKKRIYKAAAALRRMEDTNRRLANNAQPLPQTRTDLVDYGRVSVVSLAGYTDEFRAMLY